MAKVAVTVKPKQQTAEDKGVLTTVRQFQFPVALAESPIAWESADLVRRAERVAIKNDKGRDQVLGMLAQVKEHLKGVEAKRRELLDPIKKQLVAPMEKFFKGIIDPLKNAESMFKRALAGYEMRKVQEEWEFASLIEALEGTNLPAPPSTIQRTLHTETQTGIETRITSTPVWVVEVVDVALLPLDILYAAVRTKRGSEGLLEILNARVNSGVRNIPGAKITEDRKISVTMEG